MAEIAYQPRCPFCLVEHDVLSVVAVSAGDVPCICGKITGPMTPEDYRKALRKAREARWEAAQRER